MWGREFPILDLIFLSSCNFAQSLTLLWRDVKCYLSDLVRLPLKPWFPWCESAQVSITETPVLTFLALDFFLMSPFGGEKCNSQCQEDHSFTGDWEVLHDGELDSWGFHNTVSRGCLKYLQEKLLMNWRIYMTVPRIFCLLCLSEWYWNVLFSQTNDIRKALGEVSEQQEYVELQGVRIFLLRASQLCVQPEKVRETEGARERGSRGSPVVPIPLTVQTHSPVCRLRVLEWKRWIFCY